MSHYSGDYYNLEELEYSESNYTIHFYNNIAEIKISIPISVIIKTASYSGRDEDTHEVFLYPYFTHKISGVVSYTIQKEIQELFYNNIDYSIINKDSRCEEISCEIDLDEDY